MSPPTRPSRARRALAGLLLAISGGVSAARGAEGREVVVSTYPQLRDACRSALPGDVITLTPGVYRIEGAGRIAIDRRPGPVVVRGVAGDPSRVVVEGAGQDDPSVSIAFQLDDSPRWTFADLTTRNTYYHGFKFDHGSSDCTLRGVVMLDHGESGVKGTSDPAARRYPDRLLVEGCDIGFSKAAGGTRPVVEGVDGVGVADWTIRRCRFRNVRRAGGVAYAVFTKGNSSGTLLEGNRVEDCSIGLSLGGGGSDPRFNREGDPTWEHRGGVIRNNLIVRSDDAAIYVNKGRDCLIANNTLFECAGAIQLRYRASTGSIVDNLIKPSPAAPDEPIVRLRDGASATADRGNVAATDADFLGPAGPSAGVDLHLKAGSRAVDAGSGGGAKLDRDGNPRPAGRGPDAGAYERAAGPGGRGVGR